MFFSENFKKSFVFSITPVEMPISIGRLRPEDPSFLQAELLKDKVGVEIVLDGQKALATATEQEISTFKYVKLSFLVNDQTFTFKIFIKSADSKNQTQVPVPEDSSTKDSVAIDLAKFKPDDYNTNPVYKLFRYVPKRT